MSRAVEAEAAAQWCTQSADGHLLFSKSYWRQVLLIQFDLVNAGILPISVALRRLFDGWVLNRLVPYDLGLLPRQSGKAHSRWTEGGSPWHWLMPWRRSRPTAERARMSRGLVQVEEDP